MDTFVKYIQNMDNISLALFCIPLFTVIAGGIFIITILKCDNMQRRRIKACQQPSKSSKHRKENLDSRVLTNTHYNNYYINRSTGKQHKSRSKDKSQNYSNSSFDIISNYQHSSGFTVKEWIQKDLKSYKRPLKSFTAEDNIILYENHTHRNSTSSEGAASDDLISISSNDDICLIKNKPFRKVTKTRKKKPHNRLKKSSNTINATVSDQPTDVDEEAKKNLKAKVKKQKFENIALSPKNVESAKDDNFKTGFNNRNISNLSLQNQNTSLSKSVYNSLISASSTTSIKLSSTSNSSSQSANTSPITSPSASKRNAVHTKKSKQCKPPPLKQFIKLNMNEQQLIQQLRRYVIDPSLLRVYGFPVESIYHEGYVEIYKCLPKHLAEEAVTKDNQRHHRHCYGRKKYNTVNVHDDLQINSYEQKLYNKNMIDSGHDSEKSSPRFTDSDSSEMGEDDLIAPIMAFYTPDGVYQIFSEYCNSIEKQCVRCSKLFKVSLEGEYLSFDSCTYHWGKLSNVYNGKSFANIYSCCQGEEFSEGCSKHALHVWNGSVVGINGPYSDFVHIEQKAKKGRKHSKIYAIDCEMSYTALGLEVTKVTVVGYDGSLVYEHFVQPQAEIIDYNTRFSGVSEKDISPDSNNVIKKFSEVQADLLNLFDADTILVGHGLDNDLRVLRLVHKTIVDTSVIFSHSTGYPYRRSLKNLTKSFLKRDIQCDNTGHSSFEDSRACLELMMWKIRKDLRHWNCQ